MNPAERANAGLHPHIVGRIAALRPDKAARILDVGCGTGAMLRALASKGYSNLRGLDIAPPLESVAGVSFLACDLDACATPFEASSQDLIVSVEVFEHIENMGALLTEISRLLAADGHLLVTTPNVHSIEARLRFLLLGRLKQFDPIGDPTHISPVFLHPFTLLLRRHSLEIVESWGFPVDGTSPTSRTALRIAARLTKLMGLPASIAGDQLCLLIRRKPNASASAPLDKKAALTAHY